jgi:hypothetical protein
MAWSIRKQVQAHNAKEVETKLRNLQALLPHSIYRLTPAMHSHIFLARHALGGESLDGSAHSGAAISRWISMGFFPCEQSGATRQAASYRSSQPKIKPDGITRDHSVSTQCASHFIVLTLRRIVICLSFTAASAVASAQTLSPPSRSVYKCSGNGKTSYSDAPCLGAQRLDIEPTRGVGGREGRDVQRERHREMFAEALRPLTGMNAKQFDLHGRRMKLSPEAQHECRILDAQTPATERDEAQAAGERREILKVNLFHLRQRQRELRC